MLISHHIGCHSISTRSSECDILTKVFYPTPYLSDKQVTVGISKSSGLFPKDPNIFMSNGWQTNIANHHFDDRSFYISLNHDQKVRTRIQISFLLKSVEGQNLVKIVFHPTSVTTNKTSIIYSRDEDDLSRCQEIKDCTTFVQALPILSKL